MATYAIGDVQGCHAELAALLERIEFDKNCDRLWLVGDLINRGTENLAVLELVMSLGDAATTVLGNHDLHFLAIRCGGHSANRSDTFQDVLDAPNVEEITRWYRRQPLLVLDETLGYAMSHAGIPHIWDLRKARSLAAEVEAVIQGEQSTEYFQGMYGNSPPGWNKKLAGMARWRAITNYLTRMRLLDDKGEMDFSHKGSLADAPANLQPWFDLRALNPLPVKLLFGHWAAIEGHTGHEDIIALDTGCVWGRHMTALCLDTNTLFTQASLT